MSTRSPIVAFSLSTTYAVRACAAAAARAFSTVPEILPDSVMITASSPSSTWSSACANSNGVIWLVWGKSSDS